MTLENHTEKESAIASVEEQRSYVTFNFSQLCRFTVSLPLIGLVICFVTANIFQQNDIHETHCRVGLIHYSDFVSPTNDVFLSFSLFLRFTMSFLPLAPLLV